MRLLLLLLIALSCGAQDLGNASLEELMDIQVTSASKKDQKLSHTAAAIFVITQEDIRRSGASNLPGVLMMAPGLQVARIDDTRWAIASRGFDGEYSNKMLVLVDGRSVYDPIFSGVHWDSQNVPLEDIDRVEVIRGPGGSIWGSNAMNGVINVITKSAGATTGGLVRGGTGTDSDFSALIRYGGAIGSTAYRLYSESFSRNPLGNESGAGSGSDWRTLTLGFRSDSLLRNGDTLSLQGQAQRFTYGETDQLVSAQPPYVTVADVGYRASTEYLLAKWKHTSAGNYGMSLQAYFDGAQRSAAGVEMKNRIFDVEFQNRQRLGPRQDLIWGAGLRSANVLDQSPAFQFFASQWNLTASAFVQDEIEWKADRLYLTLGGKLEGSNFDGIGFQPDLRFIFLASQRHSFWFSISGARRTPAVFERTADTTSAILGLDGTISAITFRGNPSIQSEHMWGREIGYRLQPSRKIAIDSTAFYNTYSQLQSIENLPPGPASAQSIQTQFANGHRAETYGAEVAGTWNVTSRWRAAMSYSWLRVHVGDLAGHPYWLYESDATNNPHHQFQFHSSLKLRRNVDFDTALYHVGPIEAQGLGSHDRLDSRLAWRFREDVELALVGQNLLGYRQIEFRSEGYTQAQESRRNIFAKLTWIF